MNSMHCQEGISHNAAMFSDLNKRENIESQRAQSRSRRKHEGTKTRRNHKARLPAQEKPEIAQSTGSGNRYENSLSQRFPGPVVPWPPCGDHGVSSNDAE